MAYSALPRRPNKPPRRKRWPRVLKIIILLVLAGLLVYTGAWFLVSRKDTAGSGNAKTDGQTQAFDKTQYSLDDPASPWVIVNKQRPLEPRDYEPPDLTTPGVPLKYDAANDESKLRQETATALEQLFAAAKQGGVELIFVSGYRSHSYQEHLFNYFVGLQGEQIALQQSAKPGHSEHQTGWAADVGAASRECEIKTCFGETPEGQWVAAHAHEHGFAIRYPQGQTAVTGYDYEPWHLRFVGKPLAAELRRTNTQTLEQFFDLPAAPTY